MFYWGYDHYMKHAFPDDELNPIRCRGRGHDWDDLYVHVNVYNAWNWPKRVLRNG